MTYEEVEFFLDQVDDAITRATWSVIENAAPDTEFYQGMSGDWSFVVGASKDRVEGTALHKDTTILLSARNQAERALSLARASTREESAHP